MPTHWWPRRCHANRNFSFHLAFLCGAAYPRNVGTFVVVLHSVGPLVGGGGDNSPNIPFTVIDCFYLMKLIIVIIVGVIPPSQMTVDQAANRPTTKMWFCAIHLIRIASASALCESSATLNPNSRSLDKWFSWWLNFLRFLACQKRTSFVSA